MFKKMMIMNDIFKAIIDVLLVALQGVDRRIRGRSGQAWGTRSGAPSAKFNSHTGSNFSRFSRNSAKCLADLAMFLLNLAEILLNV